MSFPYCIIDGTFYSFCTTSCIHVNLTKIALSPIEEFIIDSLHSSIFFFLPSCCLSQVSGRKDKTLCFIPPNFSRFFLSGFSYWTVSTSLLIFEWITFIQLFVAKFYTWTFQLLPINQEEDCFPSFWRLLPFAPPAFHLYRRSLSRKRVQKYMDFLLIQILPPCPLC